MAVISASQGVAQTSGDTFTGPHVGASVGAVQHHFVLEESSGTGTTERFNVSRWGIGGEAFAGYDWSVTPSIIAGVEGQFEFGGRHAVERNTDYQFGFKPRYGFSGSARVGYVVSPRMLVYAGAGYGQHKYRTIAAGNVGADLLGSLNDTRSFILRGGVEAAVAPHTAVRLEFEHLDGTRNQFMVGIPIRF